MNILSLLARPDQIRLKVVYKNGFLILPDLSSTYVLGDVKMYFEAKICMESYNILRTFVERKGFRKARSETTF